MRPYCYRALTFARRLYCSSHSNPAAASSKLLDINTGLFGKLTINAPGRSVEVASLDPAQHEDIGRVLVSPADAVQARRQPQAGGREWTLDAAETAVGTRKMLKVMIPPPMNLSVTCGSSCSISVVENQLIHLTSSGLKPGHESEFRFDRVKSGEVRVNSETGPVSLNLSRSLFQSLHVRSPADVGLRASMYQGSQLSLESSHGPVVMETQAAYCRTCSLKGSQLSLKCASAHGEFELDASESGTVALDSLEGGLQLKMLQGDVSLHLTRPRLVNLDLAEGSVQLTLQRGDDSGAAPLLLDVTASDVDLEPELKALIGDAVFPLGAKAVRLVVEVPGCGGPAVEGAAPAECRVRLLSGKVSLGLRECSGLFFSATSKGRFT